MADRANAVFLEKQLYRRRRLVDWVRILPLIGLALWFLPLLWAGRGGETTGTAPAMVYLFLVWLALVFVAGVTALAMRRVMQVDQNAKPAEDI